MATWLREHLTGAPVPVLPRATRRDRPPLRQSPYPFRYLGEVDGARPFWRIVERQTEWKILARAVGDAVRFVAPAGPFDLRNEALGVRVFRQAADPRIRVTLPMNEGRIACRVAPDGATDLRVD